MMGNGRDISQDVSLVMQRVNKVLRSFEFVRPDPGPASPSSYDDGASYREVYEAEFEGESRRVRALLFRLGCVTSSVYDGSSDSVCIDVVTGEPWYVVSQQNGGVADFFLYGGKRIGYDMVRALAHAAGEERFIAIDADNWQSLLPERARLLRDQLFPAR